MALDMEKYALRLEELTKAPQRYKVEKFSEQDVFDALKMTFKALVENEGKIYDQKTDEHIKKAAKWLCGDFRCGLLLYGTVGSGKTTLYKSIMKFISIIDSSSTMRSYAALNIVKRFSDETEEDIKRTKLLFIDDLGEEPTIIKDYGNEKSPVIDILYNRYERRAFTIITTNKTEEEIEKIYGVRIADRFKDMFDRIYFSHESFRGKNIASKNASSK